MKNWDATGIFWTLEGRKNMTKKINFFPLFLRQNIRWWRCCFITTKTLSPPITKYKYIIQTTLHFLILSRQLSAFFSVCCQMNSINNVPQRALLSLRTSLAHGCAAAHTVIIFTSLSSLSSALMLSVSLPNFLFFLFFLAPSHFSPLFTNSFLHCSITSRAYLISTLFPSFSQSYSHHFLPPSFYYLPDLNTCSSQAVKEKLWVDLSVPVTPQVNKIVGLWLFPTQENIIIKFPNYNNELWYHKTKKC